MFDLGKRSDVERGFCYVQDERGNAVNLTYLYLYFASFFLPIF